MSEVTTVGQAVEGIRSGASVRVVLGINFLCGMTAQDNYTILFEKFPLLLLALGELLETINPSVADVFPAAVNEREGLEWLYLEGGSVPPEWPPLPQLDLEALRRMSVRSWPPLLENVLVIIRNMACEPCNESYVASSLPIVMHCTALALSTLMLSSSSTAADGGRTSDCSSLALDILGMCGKHLDVCGGHTRLEPRTIFSNCAGLDEGSRQTLQLLLSPHISETGNATYARVTRALLVGLAHAVQEAPSRASLLSALELLAKLAAAAHQSRQAWGWSRVPTTLLLRLVDLLRDQSDDGEEPRALALEVLSGACGCDLLRDRLNLVSADCEAILDTLAKRPMGQAAAALLRRIRQ